VDFKVFAAIEHVVSISFAPQERLPPTVIVRFFAVAGNGNPSKGF
jgi:hypothetical protein